MITKKKIEAIHMLLENDVVTSDEYVLMIASFAKVNQSQKNSRSAIQKAQN